MIRNRILLKSFAAFFIIEMLANTVAPAVSWALTAGPTAPEATSFEPVDTTDMVNINTGDMVYNMPLLEVPGPAGSYPINLSYHSGTQPEEEGSWVGLGWTLNPGAVNRMVNGIADDYNGGSVTNRVFWEGGETDVATYGVSFGIGQFATVGFGVSVASDTYRGNSVGGYVSAGVGVREGDFNLSINGTVGISPYGGTYESSGIGIGIGGSSKQGGLTANVGLDFNSDGNVSAGFNLGVNSGQNSKGKSMAFSVVGASISSANGGTSNLSVGGVSGGVFNSLAGNVQSSTSGLAVDIPVYYLINIHIGQQYSRYWIDESKSSASYGSLNFPETDVESVQNARAYDSYHLQDYQNAGSDPANSFLGSFADYDVYAANAQGLAGNFRPHHYRVSIYHQNATDKKDYHTPQQSAGVQYRFLNDFSNRVLNDAPDMEINKIFTGETSVPDSQDADRARWNAAANALYSQNELVPLYFPYRDIKTGIEGYEESGNKRHVPNVPGSKHIEYFLTQDIINNSSNPGWRKFIETTSLGFGRQSNITEGQVGAFQITNSSGVTYHFSLPAYAFNEYSLSQNKDSQNKISFNCLNQKGRYAYTWYLTAITGPDYVDRGANGAGDGKLNEFDYGYWVSFEYGKWAPAYQWRTPGLGYIDDFDNNFKTFSKGNKEIYYLNAIRTKTHTALFVKEFRADGKGATSLHDSAVETDGTEAVTWIDPGGFISQDEHFDFGYDDQTRSYLYQDFYKYPAGSLRLNQIVLLDNSQNNIDLNALCNSTDTYNHFNRVSSNGEPSEIIAPLHLGSNILDVGDFAANGTSFLNNAIRTVDLAYDYSLCPQTINSFDEAGALYTAGDIPDASFYALRGKLTLNSVSFKGKASVANVIPPVKFEYDIEDAPVSSVIGSPNTTDNTMLITNVNGPMNDYELGDILVFDRANQNWYGYVKQISSSTITIGMISASMPSSGQISNIRRTKNPPYNKDLIDIWGNYKADYKNTNRHNFDKFPTSLSARQADVWSLRKIKTATGANVKINYESDTYSSTFYLRNVIVPVANCAPYDGTPREFPLGNYGYIEVVDPQHEFHLEKYAVGEYVPIALSGTPCQFCGESQVLNSYQVQLSTTDRLVLRKYWGFSTSGVISKGYLILGSTNMNFGGGIRVGSITIENDLGKSHQTFYDYDFGGVSSGVTTYEPLNISDRSAFMAGPYYEFMKLSRYIPPPGVYYGKVRVSEGIIDDNGQTHKIPEFTEYVFTSFDPTMISQGTSTYNVQQASTANSYAGLTFADIRTAKANITNNAERMGAIQSITLFNGNGDKMNETLYHYQWESPFNRPFQAANIVRDNQQGVIQETYNYARVAFGSLYGLISQSISYPSVQIGSTTTNFKTGITSRNQVLEFDFYNGKPIKTLNVDGYGNYYLGVTQPAYKIYPQMGPKISTSGISLPSNLNMIEQVAGNYIYKVSSPSRLEKIAPLDGSLTPQFVNVGDLTKVGLVGASIQTWSDQVSVLIPGRVRSQSSIQPGIWRKESNFSFVGDNTISLTADGLYPLSSNTANFAEWDGISELGSGWQKFNQATLFSVNSATLEAKDINDNYSAVKMTFDQSKILATCANGGYDEFAYSGAEEAPVADVYNIPSFGGGINCSGTWSSDMAHTGKYSVKAFPGSAAYTYNFQAIPKPYVVNFWSSQATAAVKYQLGTSTPLSAQVKEVGKAGSWYLLEARIPDITGNSQVKIWSEATDATTYFDDFRVFPENAAMTSYVYNSWGELSHILNSENLFTAYHYDGLGRLIATDKETFQNQYGNNGVAKISEINYNYGQNNPYMITMSSTKSGSPGTIQPSGNSSVPKGGNITYTLNASPCTFIPSVLLDGVLSTSPTHTFLDGTVAYISNGQVSLKNIQGAHTIEAQFYTPPAGGLIRCNFQGEISDMCYDGSYQYAEYDECGGLGEFKFAPTWQSIPITVRGQQASFNCCDQSTCSCVPHN